MSYEIFQGDCIECMAEMEKASVDAVVCDPPYGLGFMGKEWDDLPPGREFADEALRVLKPGGHLLAFGGTRTYHRLACAVEDAGFEIRDSLLWLYGSGFPKSLDVSKAIDKAAGAAREDLGESTTHHGGGTNHVYAQDEWTKENFAKKARITAPATPEAAQWEGWGTALKPSHEPIVVARKPLIGTVAENVLEHGTGGINVDACRVAAADGDYDHPGNDLGRRENETDWRIQKRQVPPSGLGRWPSNVILSEEAAAELDAQSGELTSGFMAAGTERDGLGYRGRLGNRVRHDTHGDSGGASRFFYCAKTAKAEREAGLDGRNCHPTVKPISLMRWLCRLVTPPGGLILDPFLGSGTTGCAAVLEGFDFIGIERELEYIAIAEARIAFWAQHEGKDTAEVLKAHRKSLARREKQGDQEELSEAMVA